MRAQLAVLTAAFTALVPLVAATQPVAPPAPTIDPVAAALEPSLRKIVGRDARCKSAESGLDAVAARSLSVPEEVQVLFAVERCAGYTRVGGWEDYVDYVVTAASAVALDLGRRSGDAKAFERAIADAKNVHGESAAMQTGHQLQTTMVKGSHGGTPGETPPPDDPNLHAARETGQYHYETKSRGEAASFGAYGFLAHQIAVTAQDEMIARRQAQPPSK